MRWLLILLMLSSPAFAATGSGESGLPLPRFASLKSDEVNVRSGPGTRYPIQWVYRRDGLPIEITEEFDRWRKIRDMEGASGWVHRSNLVGARSAIVRGANPQEGYAEPDANARKVFKVSPNAVGRLKKCAHEWCELELSGRTGWMKKAQIWGVRGDEEW